MSRHSLRLRRSRAFVLLACVLSASLVGEPRAWATPIGVEASRAPVDGLGVLDGTAVILHRAGEGLEITTISPLEDYDPTEPAATAEILSAIRARDARQIAEAADDDIYSARALGELTRLLADRVDRPEFAIASLPPPSVFFEGAIRPPYPRDQWFRWLSGDSWDGPPVLIVALMLLAFGAIFRLAPRLLRSRF
ncbi:MAG: hypothetical protein AAFW88_05790 [Pseudomonadota bacterium]